MTKDKKVLFDSMVIGFALFAVFFGAGNMVFPGAVGAKVGTQWPIAMGGILLISIIFPIMALMAVSNAGNSFKNLCMPIGNWYYLGVNFLTETIVVVGTNLPRTCATTFEISMKTLLPSVPMWPFVIVYFCITYYIVFDKSGIVDKIGKVLTPALLVILVIIIGKGLSHPLASPVDTHMPNILAYTFTDLYSVGDVFSGLLFSTMFITSIIQKGYDTDEKKKHIMIRVSIVAGILFVIVYGGLLYLGACSGSLFPADVARTELLTGIVYKLMGNVGSSLLAVCVALACLTTSSGLVVIASDFFNEITHNRFPYKIWAAIFCVIGALLSVQGVEQITAMSSPVFMALYPSVIVLSIVAFFVKRMPNMGAYKYSVIFALVGGILDSLQSCGVGAAAAIMNLLPLNSAGFGWVPLAIAGFVIGWLKYKMVQPSGKKAE